MSRDATLSRRTLLSSLVAAGAVTVLRPLTAAAPPRLILTRPIPSSGEGLPLVGLGSWITFNVGDDPVARDSCTEVVRAFFHDGGRLIDSSPMYGSSQEVIGYGLRKLGKPPQLFSADKVWISSGGRGSSQIEDSRRHWDIPRFDLLQVHNVLSWEEQGPPPRGLSTWMTWPPAQRGWGGADPRTAADAARSRSSLRSRSLRVSDAARSSSARASSKRSSFVKKSARTAGRR